jgi:hypothetical protein
MTDLTETLEDFRLYCLSFWSDFYLWYSRANLNAVTQCASRVWLAFARQSLLAQGWNYLMFLWI